MARIQLRRKLTAGAPLAADLLIGELCLVIPDSTFYWKANASTIIGPIGVSNASGDMLKSTYDSTNNGVVDNAERLGGVLAASYALQASVTSQIQTAINGLVNGAPGALDALNELAAAIGNDANFAATMTTALAAKLDANSTIDGGSF